MQFQADYLNHPIHITSYQADSNTLTLAYQNSNKNNIKTINTSIIILFDNIIENWRPKNYLEINQENIVNLLSYNPEIIILGIGNKLSPIEHSILKPLYNARIPFEVMTTINACRTYNLLASEHRKVAAALIL